MIKSRILRWKDYPGGPNVIISLWEGHRRQEEFQRCYTAEFEDRRRDHEPRNTNGH